MVSIVCSSTGHPPGFFQPGQQFCLDVDRQVKMRLQDFTRPVIDRAIDSDQGKGSACCRNNP